MAVCLALSLAAGTPPAAARTFGDTGACTAPELLAIDTLSDLRIINGTNASGQRFNPTGLLTRDCFARLLYAMQYAGLDDGAAAYRVGPNPFCDVNEKHWAYNYCMWAYKTGLLTGRGVTPAARRSRSDPAANLCDILRDPPDSLCLPGSRFIFHHQ